MTQLHGDKHTSAMITKRKCKYKNKVHPNKHQMSREYVESLIQSNPVVVFSKSYCGFCSQTKKLLSNKHANAEVIELDNRGDGQEIQNILKNMTQQKTVPSVWIGGEFIGGNSELTQLERNGSLDSMLQRSGAI